MTLNNDIRTNLKCKHRIKELDIKIDCINMKQKLLCINLDQDKFPNPFIISTVLIYLQIRRGMRPHHRSCRICPEVQPLERNSTNQKHT